MKNIILKKYFNIDDGVHITGMLDTSNNLHTLFTSESGYGFLCRSEELLSSNRNGKSIVKNKQSNIIKPVEVDTKKLSRDQLTYAAQDVLFLHKIKVQLDDILQREGKFNLALECFESLKTRVKLDLEGFQELDIFAPSFSKSALIYFYIPPF